MFILDKVSSVANHFLAELRDVSIQRDPWRFRQNLERLGEILAYEVSKEMDYEEKVVTTPLGTKKTALLKEQPVLMTILRAGLPFHEGFMRCFDRANAGYIGAFRESHQPGEEIKIDMGYAAAPSLDGRVLVLVDPMLATGKSIVKAIRGLASHGTPVHTHIVSAIATPESVEYLEQNANIPYTLWTGSLDEGLNEQSYIVPGLGDAGDLSYGNKL